MTRNIQKEVIVLGMHRSGTSMVAGILECLGVDLGEDQPGRQWSNPLGHFEDVDFLSLNKDILASAGGSWDDPPTYSDIIAQKDKFHGMIQDLIHTRDSKTPGSWGWKDPRTSLTIDLYLPLLQNPSIIWCRRDHRAVTKSLQKRNRIQISDGLALLDHYEKQVRRFLARNPQIPILLLDYDDIIQAPDTWIDEIIRFLQLDPDQTQIDQALNGILHPNELQKEKWIVWVNWLVTIPIRLIRRLFRSIE
jgi:hypothetical protein